MKVIVGLGNPGPKYETTRHNIGFIVADLIGDKLGIDMDKKGFFGLYGETFYQGEKLFLLKPQTYMNLSGRAVGEIANYFKIDNEDILVIADDLDLPQGRMKIRAKGSSGGHNGLKSIIASLGGEDFPRLKLGINHPRKDGVIDYVLGHFEEEEWEAFLPVFERSAEAALHWVSHGVEETMNLYNQTPKKDAVPREDEGMET